MGNTNSNVTSGVKKQADTSSQKIYSLLDVKGGGQLITIMKECGTDRASLQQLDEKIRQLVEPFLYNKGEGKLVPMSDLILIRNRDRPKNKLITAPRKEAPHLPIPSIGSAPSASRLTTESHKTNSEHHHHQTQQKPDQSTKNSEVTINGSTVSITNPKEPFPFREVCWDLEQRGSVGETAIHLCFLNSSTAHAELAKRLIKVFPKLINDYYVYDEYYGENALHMAITNEDPAMVKFLLDNGANYHQRTVGNFFCPEDQKASRTDDLDHEWVDVTPKTNYEGHVYWGEYPHAFAACLNQEECYRLLLAKGADPDNQDTNGNTVTHIMVIHENLNMFDMVYELGGSIDIINLQNLTPLTLAAKLSGKEIFFHILKLQREIYWQLGSITCTAYPLEEIDTINQKTGEINKTSALNLVVYGDRAGHLDMIEGLLSDLLNAKWNTFIKFRLSWIHEDPALPI